MDRPIKGISVCHPTSVKEEYLLRCAQYAIEHGVAYFEIGGPMHNPVRGNCDGMMLYRKYAQFNEGKDLEYVEYCQKVVNRVLDMLEPHGIKSYFWHHELEVPLGFDEVYPEIRNADGDVEVTHPLIRDFLEHKIEDFFHTYPKMNGLVLTLHETRIPLLKLKNQKLDKVERVQYVTEILYSTCKRLGKELIVRPFASIAADYDDFMAAYERVSPELTVYDKWTKFDWSLIAPHNPFLARIKNNPLMVEGDIFGEYFGVGYLPILLKDHIEKKVAYCMQFSPRGFACRIDRAGRNPFGTPNEVNLEVLDAALDGRDTEQAVQTFFEREYGACAQTVRLAMEGTDEIQIKAMHAQGYYNIHALSQFPSPGTMRWQHRYFRNDYKPKPGTWQELAGFPGMDHEAVLADKDEAIRLSEEKLAIIRTLEGKLEPEKYYGLYMRFMNLNLVTRIWKQVALIYSGLARYFEHGSQPHLEQVYRAMETLKQIDDEGYAALGVDYYCEALAPYKENGRRSKLQYLESDLKHQIEMEVQTLEELRAQDLCDFVVAGGFSEEHNIKNEPNFSSAVCLPEGICRSAGSTMGKKWSVLKAHGWVSYDMKVRPGVENTLVISGKGQDGPFSFNLDVDGQTSRVLLEGEGFLEHVYKFTPGAEAKQVTVRIDRNSDVMPYIHTLKML